MNKELKILRFDLSVCGKTLFVLSSFFFLFGIYIALSIRYLQVIPVSIMIWLSMLVGLPFVNSKSNLDILLATFPQTRRTVIKGRYLFALLLGVVGIALSELMICLMSIAFQIPFDMKETFFTLCMSQF